MWYGLSSIAARLINYLLVPYLTYADNIKTSDYGKMALIYAALPILNILFTYGFETAYFRFSIKGKTAFQFVESNGQPMELTNLRKRGTDFLN